MNLTRTVCLCLAAGAFAFGLHTGTSTAFAAPSAQGFDHAAVFEVPPEALTFETVLDEAAMEEIVMITERIDPHLFVDSAGLVQLDAELSAEDLGVTEEFLANYREALKHSNALIESGMITVDHDMVVSATEAFVGEGTIPGGDFGAPSLTMEHGLATDGDAVPEWCTWGYNSGAMYYNSYSTYQNYCQPRQYYGLCNSMAAHLGYPWLSGNLVNHYTYNNNYMNRYCYQGYGTYYYLPYHTQRGHQQGCGNYNPCYGNLGYKPAYYWGRSYNYQSRSYNWQWNGYYCRY